MDLNARVRVEGVQKGSGSGGERVMVGGMQKSNGTLNLIKINLNQKGNGLINYIKNVGWEYCELNCDYQVGTTTAVLYLSSVAHSHTRTSLTLLQTQISFTSSSLYSY